MVGGEPGSVPVKKARSVTPRRKNVILAVFQNILSGCGGTSASMDGGGVESCCRQKKGEDKAVVVISKKTKNLVEGETSGNLVKNSDVFIIYDLRMLGHYSKYLKHEIPTRLSTIIEKLDKDGLLKRCLVASEAQYIHERYAKAVHTKQHMKLINALPLSGKEMKQLFRSHVGTDVHSTDGTKDAVLLAAGAVVEACNQVATGKCKSAFAVIRPPGHHAKAAKASGFCFLNNVAIGAKYLLTEWDVKKILIVDFDVHHGDRTQDVFYEDNSVLFFSVHRSSIFPTDSSKSEKYIGDGKGQGFNVNVNLGSIEDNDLIAVFEHVLLPLGKEYNPDFILVSSGFDAGAGDLGGCGVTAKCFGHLIHMIKQINGKLVLVLEGGYSLEAIGESSSECVKALLGDTTPVVTEVEPFISTWNVITAVRRELREYWRVFATDIDAQTLSRFKPDPEGPKKPRKPDRKR